MDTSRSSCVSKEPILLLLRKVHYQLMFIFIPMLGLNFIFGSVPTGMSAASFSFAYLVSLLTLNFSFS